MLALGLAAAGGCRKRLPLSPAMLAQVQDTAGVQPLRVYPGKKLISVYAPSDEQNTFGVGGGDIRTSSRAENLKKIVGKNDSGLILKIEELNGAPLIWVTFDRTCNAVECAYPFVKTENDKYRLIDVPKREGYKDAEVYRHCVWKKRKLKSGRMASLSEANEVLLVKKNNGNILNIILTVRSVADDRSRTRTERSGGRGTPD